MKVLHAPLNYGSLASHSVRLLRDAGIDARGLVFSSSFVQSSDNIETILDEYGTKSARLRTYLRQAAALLRHLVLDRPDIVHWYFGHKALPFALDIALLRLLRIPRLVEWQGSDIRDPQFEAHENRYYAEAWENGYEYRDFENAQTALVRQIEFARAGFSCAAPVGMLQYVQKDVFPRVHVIPQRLMISDYDPSFPSVNTTTPLVVHSPSAPVTKGTDAVLKAVESLRSHCNFEFKLIQGLPRAEALALVARADIFLDQFVLGDRGMAALEAMAMGKPVICYIKPSIAPHYPGSPIVNATQETLPAVLNWLIADAQIRHDLGIQSRDYIEKVYDPKRLVSELVDAYKAVIADAQPHR